MPQIPEFIHDPTLSEATGHIGGMRQRTSQEINSLMDLMNQEVSPFGGMPAGVENFVGQGTPAANPANWRMSRADAESPLQYMAGGPFVPGNFAPNDRGGYFTLDQLFGAGRGGNMPSLFQQGSNLPSTNNWQLTVPFGGGPGLIMRNGMIIDPSGSTKKGFPAGVPATSKTAEHGMAIEGVNAVDPGNALSGNNFTGGYYWPGAKPWGYLAWPATSAV